MSAKPAAANASEPYHHGNLRDALIAAALALEPEHGPLGVSLRELSRHVGVSHAAAYYHFVSKQALVIAVADTGFAALIAELDAELLRSPDAFSAIVGLGAAYARFSLRAPSLFRFMYGTSLLSGGPLHARHEQLIARFRVAVDRCMQAELVKRGQGDRAAAQFWSAVHGLASLTLAGALDGAPRAKATKRTARQRERRALDLVRATIVSMLFGTRPPHSIWRPAPPGGSAVRHRVGAG